MNKTLYCMPFLLLLLLGIFNLVEAASPPNVIFVLTDDLGYSDVSCYGATKVDTPHIDRLAKEGLMFTDFHTAASICSPSRAAFLTGGYPQRCGLYMGINPRRKAHWFLGLHPDEITLAEQFKRKDYKTYMVGKWHLGTEPEFLPRKQGFDQYYGMPCNYAHSPKFFDNDKVVFAKTPLDRLTALYTERLQSIIKRNTKQPFFIYYAHNYPHTPYQASKRFRGTSKDGVRGDVMQELDWSIGQMMQSLKDAGVADNTLVIFTSDNGPTKATYSKPYRGTKYVTLEGGHRVPFILHWPARIKSGAEVKVSTNAMDLFPTLMELIDQPMPEDRVFDGVSLVPLLQGKAIARKPTEPFYFYNCENLQAVRVGDWKMHLPRKLEQLPFWDKNKAFTKLQKPLLYNLKSDRGETTDVSANHPDVVEQLSKIAEDARQELGEFMSRGKSQRPTGSILPNATIISHEKDWESVPLKMRQAIHAERLKRHPNTAGTPKQNNPKKNVPRKRKKKS